MLDSAVREIAAFCSGNNSAWVRSAWPITSWPEKIPPFSTVIAFAVTLPSSDAFLSMATEVPATDNVIEQVEAATRVYAVAGDPVAHSLSPVIMNTALRRENVNGVYLPLHAKTLKDLLASLGQVEPDARSSRESPSREARRAG